jgi:DNA-binding CsgD family transcriptional regulator
VAQFPMSETAEYQSQKMAFLTLELLFYYNNFQMSIWKRFLYLIGLRPTPGPRYFEISDSLQVTLSTLAEHEGRPEHEFATELLAAGLTQYFSVEELWKKWENLTPREKEVTALVCLGYTNRQAAVHMSVTPETIKFHVHNILEKYGIKSRSQLQQLLSDWDFSSWKD